MVLQVINMDNINDIEKLCSEKLIPIGRYVLSRVITEKEEKNEMGFVMPTNFHQKPMEAIVISHGNNAKTDSLNISVGDIIILPKTGSTKVKFCGNDFQLCKVDDIIAVV